MSIKYLNSERSSSASKDEDYNYNVLDNVAIVKEDDEEEVKHKEVKISNRISSRKNQCEYCCSKYKNKKLLKIHQSLCAFKNDSSNTDNEAAADEDKIYSDTIFPCSVCRQTFKSTKGLLRHEEKHKLPGGFCCNLCNERFITDAARWAHKEKTHKVFKCLICSVKFATSEKYNEHINELHNGKDREFVICTDCGTQFRTTTQLKQHNLSKCGTEKTFFCNKCDSKFISHHTLTVHQKIHIGEKKYLCKFCGNNFLSKGQLKVHERSHTGEKPFKCEICDKAFAYRESLVTHSSLHTGIKPYICEACGTRFSCIGNLIKHRKARPDSCGLPQYNKNLKVAPRASSKNVGSLTMKKISKETQSVTNEIDKIAEIIKEVKQTADAKLEYEQRQEQRTSVITFDNESSSTTISENSKYSKNESSTTVIINSNMLNEMTENDLKSYVVTAINSNDTKNEINTINTMASQSSYQIPVITTVEETIRKYEKNSIVDEFILPTTTTNVIESIPIQRETAITAINNNTDNNRNNLSSINDDIKPTSVIEANPINNYVTTNENMEIITNVEIEYVISEELDRTNDVREQEDHQQLQKQRQNIQNNKMNTSNYEISFIGDNINELTINQVNNGYVENWQNQTCEDVSFEDNCYNEFVEPIVVDENFVVKNEDEIEIQDINFPTSIKDQNEIITIMEIDYEDNVNNDNKNEFNKHKFCVNSDEFNENLSIIDDEISSVIHESNYDNNIIKYTNNTNDNDDNYNNNDSMNHNNDTNNSNDNSHDNGYNANNDNNSNSNSHDHGNNNINNYDDDDDGCDDNVNNDDDNDDDYVNACSDYDDNKDSDYNDNNSNNSNDKEPDGCVNDNDNCDNDNDPNFLIKSKEELLDERNISVSYDCEHCPKKYMHKKPFVKHLLIQHNSSLTNHLNINSAKLKRLQQTSKKQIYECKHCKKIYFSKFILEKHILNHGPEGTLIHKCACCSKYFATMEDIKKHQLTEHKAKLQCVECKKLFKLPENLTAHVRYAHSKVERNIKKYSYVCPRCGRKFTSKIALSDHERGDCGHAPLYKCNLCDKCYHSSGSLKTHQSIHTGKLPHLCNFCGKAFRTQGQVKVHARKHTGEKPFGCEYCSKKFAYRESLLTHLSLHTGLKRFMCAGCGSRFSCISNLQAHRKSHKITCGSIPNMTKAVGPMGSEKPIRVSVKRKK